MTDLTNTVGGKCDGCGHHQKDHDKVTGCIKCECGSRS